VNTQNTVRPIFLFLVDMPTIANSTFIPIPPNIAAKTGPRLLGFMFHWGLFGALCVQVYIYHLAFQGDARRNKILVYSVFLIELAQTIFFTQSAFYIFGSGYGNFADFDNIKFSWFTAPLITGIVAFVTQMFYAYRISILASSYLVASITAILAAVQLGGAISTAVIQKDAGSFHLLLGHNYSISAGIWNGTTALCDVIIAIAMTYYLSRRGSDAARSTRKVVRGIIALVIETGTITAMLAITNLVLADLPGKPSYFLASSETLGKFYSNSMMAVLNSRMRLGSGLEDSISVSMPTAATSAPTTLVRYRNGVATNEGTESYELSGEGIKVTREEVVFPDGAEMEKERRSTTKGYFV